ncbi:unnamed protein product [Cochlearia groenlandica]
MAGWQRNPQSVTRQVVRSVKNINISTSLHHKVCVFREFRPREYCKLVKNLYRRLCHLKLDLLGIGKEEEHKIVPKRTKLQIVLKAIKQSPKKVNLGAALVRGMHVEDALMQLHVTVKRASHTVYRVNHAAQGNASHNHGLDPDRLLIAETFVRKGLFKKRISYHGKGKCGLMDSPECRLSVIVRETTAEEEAGIARLKVQNFKKLTKRQRRLVPRKVINITPCWDRKGTRANHQTS